ncbi:MAG: aldolase/citrate lyase family protein [Rubrivivax sp.]
MNPFRHLLRAAGAQPPIGTWLMSASPLVAEAVGHAGFDFAVIDMEHSPLELHGVVQMLQAIGNTKMQPVVRVPWNEPVGVKRVLDAGAVTLLFPFVQDAREAAAAVAATRYPPHGVRGMANYTRATRYGTRADYVQAAAHEVGVIVQLETPEALDALDAIAAVDGVDALFVGPADLSAALGHPGQTMHPAVMQRMTRAAQRAAELGMPIGTIGGDARSVAQYRAAGFTFVALGADIGLLMHGAQAALSGLRGRSDHVDVHTLADGTVLSAQKG